MFDRSGVLERGGAALIPVALVAGERTWGVFTSGPSSIPADPTHELRAVHVDGLEQILPFLRVTLTDEVARTETQLVVVSAYAPFPADRLDDAVQRLLPVCAPAALCMMVRDRSGWAEVSGFGQASPEAMAAAVALAKITGGWDESDPIVVEVGALAFPVSGELLDDTWRLVVR